MFYTGRAKPATINEEEINAIKDFCINLQDIKVEKMHSYSKTEGTDITYLMDGEILLIKNRTMKLNLPSLGLTMTAKMPEEKLSGSTFLGNKWTFGNKEMILPS